MKNEEVKELLAETGLDLIGCACLDPTAIAKVTAEVVKSPFFVQQRIFWHKFTKFAEGVQKDAEFSVKFSEKIENLKKHNQRDEFAQKILAIIDRIDEEKKITYILNLTKAFCWDEISLSEYHRYCFIISRCFFDDLQFVKDNFTDLRKTYHGNDSVFELVNNGLMVSAKSEVVGQTLNIKTDEYHFTNIAKQIYSCALNYDKVHIGE